MDKSALFIIGLAIAGFAVLIILPTLIYMFIAQSYKMSGSSMYPNLKNGEYFLVNKLDRNFRKGEVVVFKDPQELERELIKRISETPGESINSHEQNVTLNHDEYYVLGDNKDQSVDSRQFGPIKRDLIIGKYWFSYFKPSI